ncbi:DUF1330 domain-containing protein [Alsobacter sp. SYSU M60028]|uniref:DUF1330 domain-containing protein n=1 Tax=Alsobacter ponti TaxID=2962936 RepID=A0ABT1LH69_9HYPH|nr:DUF1330 domain-containing protein [Alsobacter ponti]MCP8940223.1 DUF1330 domain-containing protein [Alsobacter ponti]
MPAYMVVQSSVNDPQQYAKYVEAVVPLITKAGGRFIVRRPEVVVLEGTHDGRRLVIFEFPSLDHIKKFWNSPEYAPVKKIREDAAVLDIWAVEGV